MMRNALLALCGVSMAVSAQAQEMDVVRLGGQTDAFDLSDIENITFDAPVALRANDILRIHAASGVTQIPVAEIDSVRFAGNTTMTVYRSGGITTPFSLADVDSMTFASSTAHVVTVTYAGTSATVDNPLAGAGVAVALTGADVVVTSTAGLADVTYILRGTASDGMFKIYSDGDFRLVLDGVQITNANGPAVNVQADEEITVELAAGTVSQLTDGVTYVAVPGEDQKAAFFSEGQLIFTGTGGVVIHGQGSSQHGLGSDDYIVVQDGSITVASAVRDGIHTNSGFFQWGAVDVTATQDGVDGSTGPVEITGGTLDVLGTGADRDAVKCDGTILIAGGDTGLTVQGNQSKGLSAAGIQLTGGNLTIATSGGVVLEASGVGFDPSYCTAIKADAQVLLDGCHVTITTTGVAGRGISSDDTVVLQSGTLSVTSSGGGGTYVDSTGVTDAYTGPCVNADGDIAITGGTVTLSHTGSGGKGVSGDSDLTIGSSTTSPTLHITTTGASIPLGGGEYAEAKAASVDSTVAIHSGTITISTVDDAIKGKTRIDVYGGRIDIPGSKEGLESPNLFIHGGEIHLTSSDDGLNATYGVDGEFNDGSVLTIDGGYVHLNAPSGDGIDSNGNLTLAGGTILVHGPPAQPEVGLDVNGTFLVNGGLTVVSQINSNMVESPGGSSTQRSVVFRRTQTLAAGTLFHVEDTLGNSLVTFAPARTYSCILLSTSGLTSGTTYRVYTGGTCTGTVQDGLYSGGTYSGGTLRATFTSTGMVQAVTF